MVINGSLLSDSNYANKADRRDYRCLLDDVEHYPLATIEWKLISGANDSVYISGNVLTLIESEDVNEEDKTAVCIATWDLSTKIAMKGIIFESKIYKFKAVRHICPYSYEHTINIILISLTIAAFVVTDIFLFQFIYNNWKRGAL